MKRHIRTYAQTVRAASTEANGRRIVDVFLALLMTHWFDEITLDRVAVDAEVTVQTIVRRFGGKDGLLNEAARIFGDQINAQRATTPGDVDRLVANLMTDYEKTGDAVIRLLALEPRHPALKTVLDFGRNEHKRWASDAFREALAKIDGPSRRRALDSLLIATDVYTWKLLRRDMGRSIGETAAIIKNLIQGTFNHQALKSQAEASKTAL